VGMSFAEDIRPLFRDSDRREMAWRFDLWNYAEVREHAEIILERIEDGAMPCDISWPQSDVETLRTWIAEGMAP
jgi:hypothetical protein